MRYQFLVDTYATERLKVLSVWSMFRDEDLPIRPNPSDPRGRSVLEHMVHQCTGENNWFSGMLGISLDNAPLPAAETRLAFIERYAADSLSRLNALATKEAAWWEEETAFFDVRRSRAWILVRRIAHTAHHRGQQMAMLRMLGREVYSNYGPTADTGGLAQNGGRTVYAYPDARTLIEGEAAGGKKEPLPAAGPNPVSERTQSPPAGGGSGHRV